MQFENVLRHSPSPYLQQHKDNPIWWQTWGERAFRLAHELDRPIFLSVGYATCHWCHVMEGDSFVHGDIADILNTGFIPIKVDREERPDVDTVYMTALLMQQGHGGWPMTIILTPDGSPLWSGTFLRRGDLIGLLSQVLSIWSQKEKRDSIMASASKQKKFLEEAVTHGQSLPGPAPVDITTESTAPLKPDIRAMAGRMLESFDREWGGFFGAPKFPQSSYLMLLTRLAAAETASVEGRKVTDMLCKSLDCMALGGLFDQVGGGFHRYATDAAWRVPHFEKMLYDNAQLASVYTEAWQLTRKPLYAEVAGRTLAYLREEMRHPESGAFYSAEDADSEKTEGLFYLWRTDELRSVLAENEWQALARHMDLREDGNFHPPRSISAIEAAAGLKEPESANILYFLDPQDPAATHFMLGSLHAGIRAKLQAVRIRRQRPLTDTKLIASWNGLALSAFARHAIAFEDAVSLAQTQTLSRLFRDEFSRSGHLPHLLLDTRPLTELPRQLDDYAAVISGLIDAYQATHDLECLTLARRLQDQQFDVFYDENRGVFHDCDLSDPYLPARPSTLQDQATPGGNGLSCRNLMALHLMTGHLPYRQAFERLMQTGIQAMQARPGSLPMIAMTALEFHSGLGWLQQKSRTALDPAFIDWRRRFHPHIYSVIDAVAGTGPEGTSEPARFRYCGWSECRWENAAFRDVLEGMAPLQA